MLSARPPPLLPACPALPPPLLHPSCLIAPGCTWRAAPPTPTPPPPARPPAHPPPPRTASWPPWPPPASCPCQHTPPPGPQTRGAPLHRSRGGGGHVSTHRRHLARTLVQHLYAAPLCSTSAQEQVCVCGGGGARRHTPPPPGLCARAAALHRPKGQMGATSSMRHPAVGGGAHACLPDPSPYHPKPLRNCRVPTPSVP